MSQTTLGVKVLVHIPLPPGWLQDPSVLHKATSVRPTLGLVQTTGVAHKSQAIKALAKTLSKRSLPKRLRNSGRDQILTALNKTREPCG
ncbi:hypothetical protein POX_a00542 [Penicillium oxalicum]|uniref:hypothetical protein n=1 Tax=Penicillium oxalicum TaxID=69781 RepID=UPI0020B8CE99|nr:hypothetical protein POX_a00542 [Penicillium oxalicum]KAI2793954.1 hypothetical protein POX_a00542 [Penicillium oxalicum]